MIKIVSEESFKEAKATLSSLTKIQYDCDKCKKTFEKQLRSCKSFPIICNACSRQKEIPLNDTPIFISNTDEFNALQNKVHTHQLITYKCDVCGKEVTKPYHAITKLKCRQHSTKSTLLEKYGVESIFNRPDIRKNTVKALKKEETQIKRMQTCLEKYGVKNINQVKEIKAKAINTLLSNRNNTHSNIELSGLRNIYSYDNHIFSSLENLYYWIYCTENHITPDMQFNYSEEDLAKSITFVDNKYTKDFVPLFNIDLPFPYLNEDLRDTTDIGLIHHFHKSIYDATRKGKLAPTVAWQDKNIIKKVALNRLKYKGHCRPSDILQGFNVTRIANKISVFKPKLAEELIKKYLCDADMIIDPFSGFSGRMLGSFNCGKHYIGWDINEDHVRESNEIAQYKKIEDMCDIKVQDLITCEEKDWSALRNVCLFTCPPYGGKEHWNKNNDEIEKSCDEWIDLCLEKHKGCKKYLFVIDETEKYKDKIIDVITNKSHFGSNNEYIILL